MRVEECGETQRSKRKHHWIKMTELQKRYFEELARRRKVIADALDDPAAGGLREGTSDKYSDEAHFVYELLQNADDVGATRAEFELKPGELIFRHNGIVHFTITDPANEREDFKNHTAGHVNSITAYGGRNKQSQNDEGNVIGKFGLGFKSVFLYTNSPSIYDRDVRFSLEREIIPHPLENDFPGRLPEETVFRFPFDKSGLESPAADVSRKFASLIFPNLFLNHLKVIRLKNGSDFCEYVKTVLDEHDFSDEDSFSTKAQLIEFQKITVISRETTRLWLFSRRGSTNHRYSIGYVLDDSGVPRPVNFKAFCFFPTKHATGLKFLMHAPFLLNDSRENIKAKEGHNVTLINKLADLAGDSLEYLRDIGEKDGRNLITDAILDVIPLSAENEVEDEISFNAFYQRILEKFFDKRLIPTAAGCIDRLRAYWPISKQVLTIFPDDILQELYHHGCEDGEALADIHWALVSRWSSPSMDKRQSAFIDHCIRARPTEIELLDNVTAGFIKNRSKEWLSAFYAWIDESEERRKKARRLPIFLNQHCKAVAAFDQRDQHILCLPAHGADNYETINEELLRDEHTKELVERYKISEPSREDRIRYIISRRLSNCDGDEAGGLFKEVVAYYASLPQDDKTRLVNEMTGNVHLKSVDLKTGEKNYRPPHGQYLPSEFIREYFGMKYNALMVDMEYYHGLIEQRMWKDLDDLLLRLGVGTMPVIMSQEMAYTEWSPFKQRCSKLDLSFSDPADRYYYDQKFTKQYIHGASTFLKRILEEENLDAKRKLSLMLWKVLRYHADNFKEVSSCKFNGIDLSSIYSGSCNLFGHRVYSFVSKDKNRGNFLSGLHAYSYRGMNYEGFDSPQLLDLRSARWIAVDEGTYYSPDGLPINRLPDEYEHGDENDPLIRMLGIGPKEVPIEVRGEIEARTKAQAEAEARDRLSEDQKRTMDIGEKARRLGLDEADLEEMARRKREKKMTEDKTAYGTGHPRPKSDSLMSRIERDVQEYKEGLEKHTSPPPLPNPEEEFEDDDELTPKAVNFADRIKKREQRQAAEIAELERGDELQQKAQSQERYTFGWFKGLLELEMLGKEKDAENQRELSICFTKMEHESGTERTFILKRPNRNIPAWVEDLSGIPLHMIIDNKSVQAIIEVMSVQSFNLRVKLKASAVLDHLNLSGLMEAKIQAQCPTFLLNELKRGFEGLPFEDSKNLKLDLTKDIEFIFGPPGTGKTTFLAANRIIPIMQRDKDCRVLVLAPTNKAADVLAARIISEVGDDSYRDWLIRFGNTADEQLERAGVCPGKDVDLKKYPRHTVIATIARFPYDKCITGNSEPMPLVDQEWEYIVIDEASMIPLVNIIYPLYKKIGTQFIIAGDPLQIEPIISNDLWKDENIYTMVGLKDFELPKTEPHNYKVTRLATQYRSVPSVGKIFSTYSYKGVLRHHRYEADIRPLEVEGLPEIRPLTKVMFPVSPYESIYRLKRLGLKGGSSYQIYSALFAFELVCAVAKRMRQQQKKFRIGVISPYRAQADLVQKLVESEKLPEYIDISAGTVHGFQGDECEMIVALFNPPPGISDRAGSFINKKNIINVAVSRAKDYLVMLMPDDKTQNLGNMHEVRRIEAIMRCDPEHFIQHTSAEFEKAIFGDDRFIEKNAFSTGHQMVNVYGIPDAIYEVRSEDTAVDVQIHKATVVKRVPLQALDEGVVTSQDHIGATEFATFAMRQNPEALNLARKYQSAMQKIATAQATKDRLTMIMAEFELKKYVPLLNDLYRAYCATFKVNVSFETAMSDLLQKRS